MLFLLRAEMLPGLCLGKYWANWELCSGAACTAAWSLPVQYRHYHLTITPSPPSWTVVFLRALNSIPTSSSSHSFSLYRPLHPGLLVIGFLTIFFPGWWVLVWRQQCWPMARQPQVNDPTNQMVAPLHSLTGMELSRHKDQTSNDHSSLQYQDGIK